METFTSKIFLYLVIVFSATFHEYAHGLIAYKLGDPTAKYAGRLTLNPLKHLDLIGTVIIPFISLFSAGAFIGWAKPVPYNPYSLKDQKYGSLKVALAGPAANLLLAVILGLIFRGVAAGLINNIFSIEFLSLLALIIYINIFLALFNLIPVPPLDGSKIFYDLFPQSRIFLEQIGFLGVVLSLGLAFFLLPSLTGFVFKLIVGQGIFGI